MINCKATGYPIDHDKTENVMILTSFVPIIMRSLKPGFHIVVSVVSVVRKKFTGQIEFILSRTKRCICHFYCIEQL